MPRAEQLAVFDNLPTERQISIAQGGVPREPSVDRWFRLLGKRKGRQVLRIIIAHLDNAKTWAGIAMGLTTVHEVLEGMDRSYMLPRVQFSVCKRAAQRVPSTNRNLATLILGMIEERTTGGPYDKAPRNRSE